MQLTDDVYNHCRYNDNIYRNNVSSQPIIHG